MNCTYCATEFAPKRVKQKYCSQKCGHNGRYRTNNRGTDYQYSLASGNWELYFQRRVSEKHRSDSLTVQDLQDIYKKQNGLCALTGVPLTCILVRGIKTTTNASLDRINPKSGYTKDNIQLVCVAINRLRCDMSVNEFYEWCKRVTNFRKDLS